MRNIYLTEYLLNLAMPEKARQHYVPQFLLRKFASINEKNVINLVNKQSAKQIKDAPIKSQVQKNFYYGKDLTFENFFGRIEGNAAPVIAKLILTENFELLEEMEFAALLYFIGFFQFRTKTHVDRFEDKLNSTLKELSNYFEDLKQLDLQNHRISHEEPAAFLVANGFDRNSFLFDLEPYLLINNTQVDFIISDNPMVIHNPMMQGRSQFGMAQGLIIKGIVVFFPISPKHCIMLIDPWAYDVFCSGKSCYIEDISEINSINLLQAISGTNNVFFSKWEQKNIVTKTCQDANAAKVGKDVHDVIDHPTKPGAKAMFSYFLLHKLNPPFSFIRESKYCKEFVITSLEDCARESEIVTNIIKNSDKRRGL